MLFSVVSLPTMIEVQLTNEEKLDQIELSGLDLIIIRYVFTFKLTMVCVHCYSRDLSIGSFVNMGEAVRVTVSQFNDETGTQFTNRKFPIGGAATNNTEVTSAKASYEARV